MKKLLLALLLAPLALTAQKAITLDDCFTFFKFYPQGGEAFKYLKDGRHFAEADERGIHIHDVFTPGFDSLIRLDLPEEAKGFDEFTFSADETKVLLRTGTEPIYRHSVLASYYIHDLKTHSTVPVHKAAPQQFIKLSPDGENAAFVSGNNLYVRNIKGEKTTQVTRDGAPNAIINGLPDWVYEEEFSPTDGNGMEATKWSPDGSKIAFIRFDERKVPQFPLTWYEGAVYPRRTVFKYPKVGQPNSVVSVHIYDVDAGRMMGAVMGLDPDDYAPRIHWTTNNQLVVSRLNRAQDTLELLLALPERILHDPEEPNDWIPTRLLLRETDPAYVEIETENKLTFLHDGVSFLWTSERSGFNHLWLHTTLTAQPLDLTPGDFEMTAFYGVDEEHGKFYYQTATPTPMDRQVWEGSLDGSAARLLTPARGVNEAAFSPTFDYFTHTWSDANTPPAITLRNRKGEVLRTLTDNQRVKNLQKEYNFSNIEFFDFKLANGIALNGYMIKPPNFDPARKYPVLFDIYGGPGVQTVLNQYDGYIGPWRQMLAQQGIIIVSVDNRGTPSRGTAFKKCTQLQLGKLETEDQIAAARYLGRLSYVDSTRIGIWGWSFGGYLSTSCVLKGNDVFRMAMAVAPVVNWKWYDSAYTERYMRGVKDNLSGYDTNSPINYADRLRGNNYLLCHGMADDNVHWQQAVEMTEALIKANKQFDTYYYPNRNHGIYGENATKHLFTKLTSFVMEKL